MTETSFQTLNVFGADPVQPTVSEHRIEVHANDHHLRGNAARFLTIGPRVTVKEPRRKFSEDRHLFLGRADGLWTGELLIPFAFAIFSPSLRDGLRCDRRFPTLPVFGVIGQGDTDVTSQPPRRYGRTVTLIAHSFDDGADFWRSQ